MMFINFYYILVVFIFFAFQVENLFRIRLPFTELKNPFSKSKDIKILEKVVKLVEKSQNAKKTTLWRVCYDAPFPHFKYYLISSHNLMVYISNQPETLGPLNQSSGYSIQGYCVAVFVLSGCYFLIVFYCFYLEDDG